MYFLSTALIWLSVCLLLGARSIETREIVRRDSSKYNENAVSGINALQTWYDDRTGLWSSQGWWNSANALTMLADFEMIDRSLQSTILKVFQTTFSKAPYHKPGLGFLKKRHPSILEAEPEEQSSEGLDQRSLFIHTPTSNGTNTTGNWLNKYYDDEGWWALAWLKVYDITGNKSYLQTAEDIFSDMTTGYNATCGGIWWDKARTYNAAISNELFLAVAAQLAIKVPSNSKYKSWALRQWAWFSDSGMIAPNYNIIDSVDIATCRPGNGSIYTYTHGVILGALIDLNSIAPNKTYLPLAQNIAHAAINYFGDSNGILHEKCETTASCSKDATQFKGIFMRNLQRLQLAVPKSDFQNFIFTNARSIWDTDRNTTTNKLGLVWSGPYLSASASTQTSALDAIVAAAAVH